MDNITKPGGFTLIEVLSVIAILGIISIYALRGWGNVMAQKRIYSDVEALYDTFKLARSESIKRRTTITVAFRLFPGTNPSWCYALSDVGDCDCRVANACTIGGVSVVTTDTDYPTTMAITNLTGPATGKFIQFEGIRGTVSNSGSIQYSKAAYSGVVNINAMGFVANCSNTITGLTGC